MATWPPVITNLTTGKLAQGVTTLRWGTRGLLQSPVGDNASGGGDGVSSFLIVTRFTQRPLSDLIKLQNGDGLTSTRMFVVDGMQWNITVRDDSSASFPELGSTVTIVDAGGLISAANLGKTYTARVVEPEYEAAPKQAGERILTVESLLLIEGNTVGTAG
jgi:hypothetical protein